MSREILRDALVYLPARVIPSAVGLLAIPILTRSLAPEAYGQYLIATTSLTLIAGLAINWLVSVTIRFNVVYGSKSLSEACRPLLAVSMILGIGLWVVIAFALGEPFDEPRFLFIGMCWIGAQSAFEYFAGWLRAQDRAGAYGLALSWRSIVGLAVSVLLLKAGIDSGDMILLGGAVAMLAALVVLPGLALKTAPHASCAPVSTAAIASRSDIWRYGIPAALSHVVIASLSLADRYLVGAYLGAESVAIYGAHYDLAEKTIFFLNSMLLLSSSVIGFRIFERDGAAAAADFLARLMRLYLMVAPLMAVALAVLAPALVEVLLPAQYLDAGPVLPIVAIASLFVGVMHRYSLCLSFHKRTDLIMWCSAASLAINLACCLLLIPRAGLIGAALSTAFAYASWLLLTRVAASPYRPPRFPWKTLMRVAFASALAAVAMYAVASVSQEGVVELLLSFAAGSVAYLFVLFILKECSGGAVLGVILDLRRRTSSK